MNLQAGDRVQVLDALDVWRDSTADSEVEPGQKFRITRVYVDGWPEGRMPWPADSVRSEEPESAAWVVCSCPRS